MLEANPGVLARDPALLAVAEHWHEARDVRRSLTAAVDAMPAAARVCRCDEEVFLWIRVMRAFGELDDAAAVAGMSLRQAYAQSALVAHMSSRLADWVASVPAHLLSPTERRFFEREHAVHGKGEMNEQAQEDIAALADLVEGDQPDFLGITMWTVLGATMTTDLDRGAALCARARRAAAELGNVRARIMVESTDSYRSQATGDLPGAAVALREALVEFGEERDGLKGSTKFADLDVDSLDLVELAQIIEDEYGIEVQDTDLDKIETIDDVTALVSQRLA